MSLQRKLLNNSKSEDCDESKQKMEEEIKELENDLKCLNQQISETQQRIVEADQGRYCYLVAALLIAGCLPMSSKVLN